MGCFCNWGNDGEASVIRDLGGLEGDVKNAGEGRSYVGVPSFKDFGKEPMRAGSLIGVGSFEGSLGF